MRKPIQGLLAGTTILLLTACSQGGANPRPTPNSSEPSGGSSVAASPSNSAPPVNAISNTGSGTPIERVVQQLQPSVVRVSVSGAAAQSGPFGAGGPFGGVFGSPPAQAQQQGAGTGMVLDSQGHILT